MSILESAIGWVAPPQCLRCNVEGAALCAECADREIIAYGETCWSCGVKSSGARTCPKCRLPGTPSYVWVSTVYEATATELLKRYKFGHQRAAAPAIAGIMAASLYKIVPPEVLNEVNYLVVAVPTATSRIRHRGFDHADLLTRQVARRFGLSYAPVLGRLGQSRQVGSKRSDRLAQNRNNYFVRLPALVKDRRILLVDDVVTTGATLRAATRQLRLAGAKHVDALVFAKRL